MKLVCTSHKSFRNLKSNCRKKSFSALGTSDLSKFINMRRLYIKLGKARQCHITKQLLHSFSVNARISQPLKVMSLLSG